MSLTSNSLVVDGTPVIRLESEFLKVDIAPEVGGRVISVLNKKVGQEFLWRNEALSLKKLSPGSEYDPNFYGGIDELMPNDIAEVINGINCPDHGELWTTALEWQNTDRALKLSGRLPDMCGADAGPGRETGTDVPDPGRRGDPAPAEWRLPMRNRAPKFCLSLCRGSIACRHGRGS